MPTVIILPHGSADIAKEIVKEIVELQDRLHEQDPKRCEPAAYFKMPVVDQSEMDFTGCFSWMLCESIHQCGVILENSKSDQERQICDNLKRSLENTMYRIFREAVNTLP